MNHSAEKKPNHSRQTVGTLFAFRRGSTHKPRTTQTLIMTISTAMNWANTLLYVHEAIIYAIIIVQRLIHEHRARYAVDANYFTTWNRTGCLHMLRYGNHPPTPQSHSVRQYACHDEGNDNTGLIRSNNIDRWRTVWFPPLSSSTTKASSRIDMMAEFASVRLRYVAISVSSGLRGENLRVPNNIPQNCRRANRCACQCNLSSPLCLTIGNHMWECLTCGNKHNSYALSAFEAFAVWLIRLPGRRITTKQTCPTNWFNVWMCTCANVCQLLLNYWSEYWECICAGILLYIPLHAFLDLLFGCGHRSVTGRFELYKSLDYTVEQFHRVWIPNDL